MVEGLGQRLVLLVEDETLVAMVAEDNLRFLGFEPICVESGAEALLALDRTPNLAFAIIDIGLPDMRGDALAIRFREKAPGLPIVMASGYDSATIARQFAGDKAMAVLGKPYSEFDLKKVIESLGLSAG